MGPACCAWYLAYESAIILAHAGIGRADRWNSGEPHGQYFEAAQLWHSRKRDTHHASRFRGQCATRPVLCRETAMSSTLRCGHLTAWPGRGASGRGRGAMWRGCGASWCGLGMLYLGRSASGCSWGVVWPERGVSGCGAVWARSNSRGVWHAVVSRLRANCTRYHRRAYNPYANCHLSV